MKNKNTEDCDYKTMYKQKEDENKYIHMQLEEMQKALENRIYNMETDLKKYEKENKWLKDIINSILHIK